MGTAHFTKDDISKIIACITSQMEATQITKEAPGRNNLRYVERIVKKKYGNRRPRKEGEKGGGLRAPTPWQTR